MTKTHHDLHAADARRALDAYTSDAAKEIGGRIAELITDLGHLCSAEQIDFLASLITGIRDWARERIDPSGEPPGPTVEVTITVQGLAPPARPKAKRKPKKPR